MNSDKDFGKKVLEIGTANLRSYVKTVNEWFDYDLAKYNFYLMPISFFHSFEVESFSINRKPQQIKNLLKYINQKEKSFPSDEMVEHNISLRLVTKFEKGTNSGDIKLSHSSETPDITFKIDAEEQFAKKYPMDYAELIKKLKARYTDWKPVHKFWNLKREIEKSKKYSDERFLDYKSNNGSKKRYYSTEIFKEFDKHYTKSK